MLILQQARPKFRPNPKMDSYVLGLLALGVSVPFGVMSAQVLQIWLTAQPGHANHAWQAWLAGLILGASLFTYTILLVQLMKRQPPLFLKRLFRRQDLLSERSINELSGLRLDYIGAKDPQDNIDGVVHNRAGELQRILRCKLPQRFSYSGQSLILEMLFAYLSGFSNARFQLIFPEAANGRREEMLVIASHQLSRRGFSGDDELPPLVQMQFILEKLMDRLITLGIMPKIMNAIEVREIISTELGGCTNRSQLYKDWREVGNLGWEPSFRDILIKPNERFMQISEKRSATFAAEKLPANGSFEWLSAVLSDIPGAQVSLFVSPWRGADPLSKLRMAQKLRHLNGADLSDSRAAQMSFFFRIEGHDEYLLESETTAARKYLCSLGVNTGTIQSYRQLQLQNWRATLPCAQDQAQNTHLIAF